MISRELEAEILRLSRVEGWSTWTIATQLGVHHDEPPRSPAASPWRVAYLYVLGAVRGRGTRTGKLALGVKDLNDFLPAIRSLRRSEAFMACSIARPTGDR